MTGASLRKAIRSELKRKRRAARAAGNGAKVESLDKQLESLTRRPCRRTMGLFGVPPCERTFVPEVTVSTRTLRTTCSSECAMLLMAQRENDGKPGTWTRDDLSETIDKMTAPDAAADPSVREARIDRLRAARAARGPATERMIGDPRDIVVPDGDKKVATRAAAARRLAVGQEVKYVGRNEHASGQVVRVVGFRPDGGLVIERAGERFPCSPFSVAATGAAPPPRRRRLPSRQSPGSREKKYAGR